MSVCLIRSDSSGSCDNSVNFFNEQFFIAALPFSIATNSAQGSRFPTSPPILVCAVSHPDGCEAEKVGILGGKLVEKKADIKNLVIWL